jgi:hypothetical protein
MVCSGYGLPSALGEQRERVGPAGCSRTRPTRAAVRRGRMSGWGSGTPYTGGTTTAADSAANVKSAAPTLAAEGERAVVAAARPGYGFDLEVQSPGGSCQENSSRDLSCSIVAEGHGGLTGGAQCASTSVMRTLPSGSVSAW